MLGADGDASCFRRFWLQDMLFHFFPWPSFYILFSSERKFLIYTAPFFSGTPFELSVAYVRTRFRPTVIKSPKRTKPGSATFHLCQSRQTFLLTSEIKQKKGWESEANLRGSPDQRLRVHERRTASHLARLAHMRRLCRP